ncbi:Na/Pi cotransporter family protein [Anaerotalea alkaliphila]|uniref:Na/Pi cotransporter family protein n=1 Tax=Anaerotalea alkaliphila TaxID=2662126 RepID=A0A7X5HT50_9FIRM|nr:Na/Pi cotransporter family protein [Anaerotalea alkaliphila]NDL66192.1 Na/Pi cotransporter family protein [Anaerotalea alkaliphila]
MSTQEYVFLAFAFFGGFGMFIFGMHIMAEGLQKSAGDKMRNLLALLTNNRLLGVLVGTVVTVIVQSSSATTVMVVGFVNAGLMNLVQAVGVIMGANVGTTVTAWIVSSSEWAVFLKPDKIAPMVVGIGATMLFFLREKRQKQVGEILIGFGLIFIGLEYMKDAITPFKDAQAFKDAFLMLGHHPFFGILAGFLVTAIVQSSSASVGILQTLAAQGLVPWSAAVYIILGQNIGTCVTALLSSIGASKMAKRAAVIHLLFNIFGTLLFTVGTIVYFKTVGSAQGAVIIGMTGISIFHTVFNISNTVLLYPFADKLVYLSEKIVTGKDVEEEREEIIALRHLDNRILESPTFAVENAIKEVVHMGELAVENVRTAVEALVTKDEGLVEKVFQREKDINALDKMITDYLIKISNTPLSEKQQIVITNLFHTVTDLERVGDHAENIAELAAYYKEKDLTFTPEAMEEFGQISRKAIETIELAIQARRDNNPKLVPKVEDSEEEVDALEELLRQRHIERLAANLCNTVTGVVFLDSISNFERISDHALNVAYFVKDEAI